MYKIPKQSYTIEFKQEAVRQVEKEGKSPAQAPLQATTDSHHGMPVEPNFSDNRAPSHA